MDLPRFQATIEGWQARLQEATGMEIDLLGSPLQTLLQDPLEADMHLLSRAFGVAELLALLVLVLAGAIAVAAKPNEQLLDPL